MRVGVLGRNGSGKSTLLSVLAGIQRADAGSFWCDGADLMTEHRLRSQTVGYVPQGTPFMEELSAWDNLLLWYTRAQLRQELENGVLAALGIGEFVKMPVYKLSGGMKKRLSIGCAMAGHPRILLMDEPGAALDLVAAGVGVALVSEDCVQEFPGVRFVPVKNWYQALYMCILYDKWLEPPVWGFVEELVKVIRSQNRENRTDE
jgi:ABC-type multidrug transport system ATPase subunit